MPLPHRSIPISTPHWYKLCPTSGPALTPGLVLPKGHTHLTAPFPLSHPTFPRFPFRAFVSKAITLKHRQGRLRDVMWGSATQHSQHLGTSAPNSLV